MARQSVPGLSVSFESIRHTFRTAREQRAMSDLYSGIASSSFSNEVLSGCSPGLSVISGSGLGWSDLGEPLRVQTARARKRFQSE